MQNIQLVKECEGCGKDHFNYGKYCGHCVRERDDAVNAFFKTLENAHIVRQIMSEDLRERLATELLKKGGIHETVNR